VGCQFPQALPAGEEKVVWTVLMPVDEYMLGAAPIQSGQFQYEVSPIASRASIQRGWRTGWTLVRVRLVCLGLWFERNSPVRSSHGT
jgi:hypothetical protein